MPQGRAMSALAPFAPRASPLSPLFNFSPNPMLNTGEGEMGRGEQGGGKGGNGGIYWSGKAREAKRGVRSERVHYLRELGHERAARRR
eukprot:scaffold55338_cov32-Tisochrysis_lutea.AAC.2